MSICMHASGHACVCASKCVCVCRYLCVIPVKINAHD